MSADQSKCVDIHFCCEANHFPDCSESSEEKNGNITGETASAVLCEAGIVECLKGWRCGGVWEGWRCVGGVEECGRGGGVWEGGGLWEGWRCVGGMEVCGRGGGMWWEGWRNVVGRVSCVVGGVVLGRCEVCG